MLAKISRTACFTYPPGQENHWFMFIVLPSSSILSSQGLQDYGKFGGATGNYNAHHVAYPQDPLEGIRQQVCQRKTRFGARTVYHTDQ